MIPMLPTFQTHLQELPSDGEADACGNCGNGEKLGFQFSYAYQPIVNVASREIFAHEALVRGIGGESAHTVLSRVTDDNRYRFDQACRVKAIRKASEIGLKTRVSINFLPNAIYRPEVCIRTTLEAARAHDFPVSRIVFETVEGERVADGKWFSEVLTEYKRIGFLTAIDDFGAGFAGLNLLAHFQPDIVKLDMELVRDIDTRRASQAIVRGVADICHTLGIQVIAEGIETVDEYLCLESMGIQLMQGYLFARPLFESHATVESIAWPAALHAEAAPQADGYADDPFAGVNVTDIVAAPIPALTGLARQCAVEQGFPASPGSAA
jgi:EAL domain-containing protein (putative c-di-GMP-specific phosphodiesterase class I)